MISQYRQLAVDITSRLLTRLDRCPWSPTFGCFDREFWKYKTLTEFPRSTFQQSLISVALLHQHPFEGNLIAGDPNVLQWLIAGIQYWLDSRNKDGSVNEWYLNEHSFCATAFTTASVTQTILLLGQALSDVQRQKFTQQLSTTGDWLCTHENPMVANQTLASLVALQNLVELTGSTSYQRTFETRRLSFLTSQSSEGWYPEYGGSDIGYSFLALDLMVEITERTPDPEMAAAAKRLLEFIAFFVHPDGTSGGEYGSRSTLHSFPFGIEVLARRGDPTALRLLPRIRAGITTRRSPTPGTVDDSYAAYFYAKSFCATACLDGLQAAPSALDFAPAWTAPKFFEKAGLMVEETENFYLVIGASRGGVWRLFDKKSGKCWGDVGYIAVNSKRERFCSQSPGQYRFEPGADGWQLMVETPLALFDVSLPLVRHVVLFKLLTRSFLKVSILASLFSKFVKEKKILTQKSGGIQLRRTFRLKAESLVIEDNLSHDGDRVWTEIYSPGEGSLVHSPSSQMFSSLSLLPSLLKGSATERGQDLMKLGKLTRTWVYPVRDTNR